MVFFKTNKNLKGNFKMFNFFKKIHLRARLYTGVNSNVYSNKSYYKILIDCIDNSIFSNDMLTIRFKDVYFDYSSKYSGMPSEGLLNTINHEISVYSYVNKKRILLDECHWGDIQLIIGIMTYYIDSHNNGSLDLSNYMSMLDRIKLNSSYEQK